MCERNMPTVYIFKEIKEVAISMSSEVVIRPTRINAISYDFKFEGPFVDIMAFSSGDTLRSTLPVRSVEPGQYMNAIMLTYAPFSCFTMEPRPNLVAQMMFQGINNLPIQGDATLVSTGQQEPIVVSDFMS